MGIDLHVSVFIGIRLKDVKPGVFGDKTAAILDERDDENAEFDAWKKLHKQYSKLAILRADHVSGDDTNDMVGFYLTRLYELFDGCFPEGEPVEKINENSIEKYRALLVVLFKKKPFICRVTEMS